MTRETLLESLAAVADENGVYLHDDDGTYIDWSSQVDGKWIFEVGDDSEAVQVYLSRADLVRLHAALTRTLLLDAE